MAVALQTTPRRGQDPVLTAAQTAVRLGAVVAVILGLGMLFSLWRVKVGLHMGSGLLAILGVWVAAVRRATAQQSSMALWMAALLGLAGAWAAISHMPGYMHWGGMLVMVCLAELGAAQAGRH